MITRFSSMVCAALAVGLLLAGTASAATVTLGTTTQPTGSETDACDGGLIAQYTSDPSTQYMVPTGGGLITSWSTNVSGDTPGDAVTFAVLRPTGGENYTVVGTDNETIPNPLPADNIATYTLATPIAVTGGETLGLFNASGTDTCYWDGGSTPLADSLMALDTSGMPPTTGESLSNEGEISPQGFTMDLSATLGPNRQDAGVSTTANPSTSAVKHPAVLSSTVSNAGPGDSPITFTDQVPSGLTVNSASVGSGTCSTSGQTVTCTSDVLAGQSTSVNILVTPTATGMYTNHVSVAPSFGTETNAANNTASATLDVKAAPVLARCVVPSLRGTPIHVARHLLRLLGCRIGKIKHVSSNTVRKWGVIRTSPKPGKYSRGRRIAIRVSSGPKGA